MISFTHKEYLWLFTLLPVLIYWFWTYSRWRKKVRSRIGTEKIIQLYIPAGEERVQLLRKLFLSAGFICLVFALADPTLYQKGKIESAKGRDLVVLLDVSKSMLAADEAPSRLEAGKELVRRLIRKFPDERFGLILFAGRPYFSMPLTTDIGSMELFLETAGPDAVPAQGSGLGEALRMSIDAFLPEEKRQQVLLVITDGEEHSDEALKAVGQLKEKGINIILVGCGTEQGATIPESGTSEPKKDRNGNIIITKMNAGLLQQLAFKADGRLIQMSDSDNTLERVTAEINQLEKTGGIQKSSEQHQTHSFMIFILAALLFLLLEPWLRFPFKRGANVPVSILLLLLMGSMDSRGQSDVFEKGAYYYQRSDFAKAAQLYQNGISTNEDARLYYNLGNCLFRLGKTEEAFQQYGLAFKNTHDPTLQTGCLYNKAVVLHQTGRLEEAVENYKRALLLKPDDASVRKNLQLALTQLHARQNRTPVPPPESKSAKPLNMQELQKQEKDLQKRLQQKNSRPDISEKDW